MVARNALRAVVFAALAMGVSILDARVVSRKLVEMRSTSTTSASLPTSRESTKPKSFALADLDTLGTNDDDGGGDGEDHTRNSGAAPKKGAKEAVALSRRDDKAKTNASAGTNAGTATRDVLSRRKGESTSSGASSRDETEVGTTSKTGNRSAASEEKKEKEKKRDSRSRDPFSREVDLSPEDGGATRKDAPHKRSKKNNDDRDDDGDDDDDDKDASYRLPKSQREAQAEARHKAQAERRAKREAQKKVWRKIKEQERAEREAAKARARSDTSAIQAAAGGKRNSTATKEQQK